MGKWRGWLVRKTAAHVYMPCVYTVYVWYCNLYTLEFSCVHVYDVCVWYTLWCTHSYSVQ